MAQSLKDIDWKRMDEAIPAFTALLLIPLTYSITQGIVWGFLIYTFTKLLTGRFKEVTPMLLVIDAFAVIALFLMRA